MKDEVEIASDDLDPAAPLGEGQVLSDEAIGIANNGTDGRGDVAPDEAEPDLGGMDAVATLDFDVDAATRFLRQCMDAHVGYGLGAKIKPGQTPGQDFTKVDCSGFVRETMRRSTNLGNKFPDGSVVQHEWVRARGFATDDLQAGTRNDGAVRIAFLSPGDTASHIGHVVLIHKGRTLESHGGTGPDSRPWTGSGWQARSHVFVLMPAD